MVRRVEHNTNLKNTILKMLQTRISTAFCGLTRLNLTNKNFSYLPKELGMFPCLQELDVSKNDLGNSNCRWDWLEQNNIKNTLLKLDLKDNFLTSLPLQIGKLNALQYLDLSNNMLEHLPQNIGELKTLRNLYLAENILLYLPGSIAFLTNLEHIHVECNLFSYTPYIFKYVRDNIMLSLVELAARAVANLRIACNILPVMVRDYLNTIEYCRICGCACVIYDAKVLADYLLYKQLNLISRLQSVLIETEDFVEARFEYYTCSYKCTRQMYGALIASHPFRD